MSLVNQRIRTYILVMLGSIFLYYLLSFVEYKGTKNLHTIMEIVAFLLAFISGTLALIRYYSQRELSFLFIGTGFLGTSFLDFYHAVVTSVFFDSYFPSVPESLIPWSWIASRLFLSILMVLSLYFWHKEVKEGTKLKTSDTYVYVIVSILTLMSFALFAFVPMPKAYYAELFFHRPEEFLPALFFSIALFGYLKKGLWKTNNFEHWIVISLILGLVSQLIVMPLSSGLFDLEFDLAHIYKKFSYIAILIGLLISIVHLYRETNAQQESLSKYQTHLLQVNEDLHITNRLKSEFLANMSHELRTPLNSIIGFSNILLKNKEKHLNEKELSHLNKINKNGSHLLSLINDILDLSKVESGKITPEVSSFNLGILVQQCIDLVQGQSNEKEVSIELFNTQGEDVDVNTDAHKLKQVVLNLISNAIKFVPEKNGHIEIYIREKENYIYIDITDNGIGIEEASQKLIFEAFRQADGSTSRAYGGTGLGLTICKNIISLLNGDILLKSEIGKGSCFTVKLPRKLEDSQSHLPDASEPDDKHVLIIDDNEEARILIKEAFDDDITVHEVSSGIEALELLSQGHHYDLICLDLMMPHMDGPKFLDIATKEHLVENTPIFVITAKDLDTKQKNNLLLYINTIIHKGPYMEESIRVKSHLLLDKHLSDTP